MSVTLLVAATIAANPSQTSIETTAYARDASAIVLPLNLGVSPGMGQGASSGVSPGMLEDNNEPMTPVAPVVNEIAFGAEDSWRWSLWGGYAADFDDSSEGHLGVGLSWFFVKDLSLDFELKGIYFDQPVDNAFGGNFNLLVRWHFLMRETWSLYADLGAGLLVASDDVPHDGSEVNFTPQAGVGASFEVADNVRMMTGVRWHHISNANMFDENPGQDTLMAYAGFSFPF